MDEKKYSVASASKEPMDRGKTVDDDRESTESRSDSRSEAITGKKSSKHCSKRPYSKRKCKDEKRHSSSSRSSMEK